MQEWTIRLAARRRLHLHWIDRALFIWFYRRYPRILDAISIVRPETVVRWHRKGFTGYSRWKSNFKVLPRSDDQASAASLRAAAIAFAENYAGLPF